MVAQASKLLCLRVGIERQRHVFESQFKNSRAGGQPKIFAKFLGEADPNWEDKQTTQRWKNK